MERVEIRHIRTGKVLRYPARKAAAFVKLRGFEYVKAEAEPAAPPAVNVDKAELSAEYEDLTGNKPDGRWGAERLAEEIAEARRGTYIRRDMTAEE
jgi:hypothetical protein